MPERKSGFIATALALLALAYATGFFVALVSIGRSGVLYTFALAWETTKAFLYLAAWAPAIILVASAIAVESSETKDGFSGAAYRVMTPALVLSAIISIFYLLVVPGLEERTNRYESQSQLFTDSLGLADTALREGRLDNAERHLLACAAIDIRDERYIALNDRVKSAEVKAMAAVSDVAAPASAQPTEDPAWKTGNRFYLEALEARNAGRLFDAHYLAKRSAAIYDKRPEVRRLVEETWRELQKLGASLEARGAAAYYQRKLEGYARFQEGDYLEAYRIYSELSAEDGDDADVATYLSRSAAGLSTIAFFIEEDEKAFSRSDERAFSFSLSGPGGWLAAVSASRAATSGDAVYFRDLSLNLNGSSPVRVRAPFARLHGDTLILRAVDRSNPDRVWAPEYESVRMPDDPGFAIKVPFDQEDAAAALRLSGAPEDIPLMLLATGIDDAERLGIDIRPLLAELASRTAFPFVVLMLALMGAGLGVRFKPSEPVGTVARYLTAPLLVALALAPLRALESVGEIAGKAFAEWIPGAFFLPAWLGFMGLCVVASLFAAARIASHSTR